MKTTQRGFIVPLLLIVIALFLAGGGAYFYTQTKSENPPVTENITLPQATSTAPAVNQTTQTTQATSTGNSAKPTTVTFNVYFGKETDSPDTTNCSHVIARTISYTSAVGQASLAELFKGPTPSEKQQGYFSCIIGKNVVVRSLKIENGTATVNLSKEYNDGCGGAAMCSAQARSAVTNTLKQFPEIKTVQIQIEGVPQTIGGDV